MLTYNTPSSDQKELLRVTQNRNAPGIGIALAKDITFLNYLNSVRACGLEKRVKIDAQNIPNSPTCTLNGKYLPKLKKNLTQIIQFGNFRLLKELTGTAFCSLILFYIYRKVCPYV